MKKWFLNKYFILKFHINYALNCKWDIMNDIWLIFYKELTIAYFYIKTLYDLFVYNIMMCFYVYIHLSQIQIWKIMILFFCYEELKKGFEPES
jgi:hypothetical protein